MIHHQYSPVVLLFILYSKLTINIGINITTVSEVTNEVT